MTTGVTTLDLQARAKSRGRLHPAPSPHPGPGPFDERARFAAFVAHELRTQVAIQLALAQATLADAHAGTPTLRAMGEGVVASCEQQQRVIEAILDLTLSHRGLRHQAPVDLAALTRRALQAHQVDGFDSVVALKTAVATGDPTLLELLAANLISNATRHNVPGGRIEVATRTDARRAVLSVANTGLRIPAGELARLFQPFERLGSQSRGGVHGVGLGLAIVQSIADAHRATIAARPRVGGGLEIEIRFAPQRAAKRSRRTVAVNNRATG